jgi:hypothetical protein
MKPDHCNPPHDAKDSNAPSVSEQPWPSGKGCGCGRLRVLLVALGLVTIGLAIHVALDPDGFGSGVDVLLGRYGDDTFLGVGPEVSPEKIIEKDGRLWLWGGSSEAMHFDLAECSLNLEGLRYGLGREAFPALIEPRFISGAEASKWLDPTAPVLVVHIGEEIKVYPVSLLTRHEVVNDVVAGRPIFAAYCILANLGAIYDRQMGDHTFTFAVSGYTCGQTNVWGGRQAFVLWDRDTESLWWPTMGTAVSGPMLGAHLKLLNKSLWSQTTWGVVKDQFPEVRVLDTGQDFNRPQSWPKYSGPFDRHRAADGRPELAPAWGENGPRFVQSERRVE